MSTSTPALTMPCPNYLEVEDRPCTGTITFPAGASTGRCDTCNAQLGRLSPDALTAEHDAFYNGQPAPLPEITAALYGGDDA